MWNNELRKCRLCTKLFCCESCRKKHEKNEHNAFPDCNICFNGKVRISEISEELLTHFETNHWPLHCVFCKRVFNCGGEIREHIKCPVLASIRSDVCTEKSPLISSVQISDASGTFESPPFAQKNQTDTTSNLATSTPLQTYKDDNNLLQKIKTVIITPVNTAENTSDSILKKTEKTDNHHRRVTFCETILTENMPSHDENYNHKSAVTETPATGGNSTEVFCSAKEELSNVVRRDSKRLSNTPKLPPTKKVSVFKLEKDKNEQDEYPEPTESHTVWISATNISTIEEKLDEDQSNSSLNMEFVTPLATNPKKKKINVVMPTPIIKDDVNLNIRRPMQISSTPNNSMIPVKSIPTAKEIFLKSLDQPSTSKSALEFSDETEIRFVLKDDENSNRISNTSGNNSNDPEIPFQNRLWLSVHKFVKNVTSAFQNFSTDDTEPERPSKDAHQSFKRCLSDNDSEDEPKIKRFKLTEIKCRRPIRDLSSFYPTRASSQNFQINIVNNVTNNVVNNIITVSSPVEKTFVDKATQTEDDMFAFHLKNK